jgi:hypothetical protein
LIKKNIYSFWLSSAYLFLVRFFLSF